MKDFSKKIRKGAKIVKRLILYGKIVVKTLLSLVIAQIGFFILGLPFSCLFLRFIKHVSILEFGLEYFIPMTIFVGAGVVLVGILCILNKREESMEDEERED